MLGIVVSRADEASTHIGEHLRDLADWERREDGSRPDGEGGGVYWRIDDAELRAFDDLHLHLEGAAEPFDDPDLLAFASRHSGETGALLTAHVTGNVGPAEFGGRDGELARAPPNAHAAVLDALDEHAPDGYEVGMECTHHGPSGLDVPSMFVEVGSGEAEWRDPAAARAVARAILDLRGVAPDRERTIVGFGGGHYAPRFERIVRETGWAVGHVAADWALDAMDGVDPTVVGQAFERSAATRAVVDGDRPALERVIEDFGYRVVSETWLRAVDGVPLDLVDRAEDALSTVESGLRFGAAAADGGPFEVYDLDDDLLADANGVDRERVREAVTRRAVAFETAEGGTLVDGRVALPPGAYGALIDDLAALLGERYDAVERADDALIVHDTAFDPSKARTLGVPEGPAFGRLADGEAVEVDGETIPPDAVHVERTRRYPI